MSTSEVINTWDKAFLITKDAIPIISKGKTHFKLTKNMTKHLKQPLGILSKWAMTLWICFFKFNDWDLKTILVIYDISTCINTNGVHYAFIWILFRYDNQQVRHIPVSSDKRKIHFKSIECFINIMNYSIDPMIIRLHWSH